MTKRAKEKWGVPQLVILTKYNLGERVLATCKGPVGGEEGYEQKNAGCYQLGCVDTCYDLAAS